MPYTQPRWITPLYRDEVLAIERLLDAVPTPITEEHFIPILTSLVNAAILMDLSYYIDFYHNAISLNDRPTVLDPDTVTEYSHAVLLDEYIMPLYELFQLESRDVSFDQFMDSIDEDINELSVAMRGIIGRCHGINIILVIPFTNDVGQEDITFHYSPLLILGYNNHVIDFIN